MKRVLITYGGWEGHEPRRTSEFVATLLRRSGMVVELSDTLDTFLDRQTCAALDLIVMNWTMGTLTPEQSEGLSRAVREGTGLGGWHAGLGDAFRGDTDYQFMVGGQFVGHPDDMRLYRVTITNRQDPIVADLDDFEICSEQYYMHVDPANQVLATTTFETMSAPWVNGTVMPVVWKRMYGKGRVFYSSIGHGLRELQIEPVRQLTLRGLLWAAGQSRL